MVSICYFSQKQQNILPVMFTHEWLFRITFEFFTGIKKIIILTVLYLKICRGTVTRFP